jgi:hypothetical protein
MGLRLKYVVTKCGFLIMERRYGTKTGVRSHKLRFFSSRIVIFQSWSEEKILRLEHIVTNCGFSVTEGVEWAIGKRCHKS